ncbi:unnamed protein product [Brassica rapa subsp. trilocularis]
MWGDNSSIDSGVSFFRWSMMVTSARFSCFVPSFLHQSALVFWCYALVLGDQISYAVMLLCSMFVTVRIIGAVPVSNMNFYKLLLRISVPTTHVVLYPGLYVKLCTEM